MHIAVNALFLRPSQVGGTERYLRELLDRLTSIEPEGRWTIYLSQEGQNAFREISHNICEVIAPVESMNRTRRLFAEQTWLAARLFSDRPDVLWNPGASLPWAAPVPQVTTVHDCITKVFPEYFGRLERTAIEWHVSAAVRLSHKVLVPSGTAQKDICWHYGADPQKVGITPEAASKVFRPAAEEGDAALLAGYDLSPGGYFLTVASLLPHKRVGFLLAAYARARSAEKSLPPLVWTGPGEPERVNEWAREEGVSDCVRALGWASLEHMPALYRGAAACLHPSSFEGFGLAALEALACGTPLLATPCSAILETVGDACLYCPSDSEDGWAAQIREIWSNKGLRQRLREAGPARAAVFSWEKTARETLAALREAAYQ